MEARINKIIISGYELKLTLTKSIKMTLEKKTRNHVKATKAGGAITK